MSIVMCLQELDTAKAHFVIDYRLNKVISSPIQACSILTTRTIQKRARKTTRTTDVGTARGR